MSGQRPWGVIFWQSTPRAPFYSLGVHLDLHTPTLDLHLPGWTVQIGRNTYWTPTNRLPGMRFGLGGRVALMLWTDGPWSGHSDNCDHARSEYPPLPPPSGPFARHAEWDARADAAERAWNRTGEAA